jgi:hypothetical protein
MLSIGMRRSYTVLPQYFSKAYLKAIPLDKQELWGIALFVFKKAAMEKNNGVSGGKVTKD